MLATFPFLQIMGTNMGQKCMAQHSPEVYIKMYTTSIANTMSQYNWIMYHQTLSCPSEDFLITSQYTYVFYGFI